MYELQQLLNTYMTTRTRNQKQDPPNAINNLQSLQTNPMA